jgi:hypothetical protein
VNSSKNRDRRLSPIQTSNALLWGSPSYCIGQRATVDGLARRKSRSHSDSHSSGSTISRVQSDCLGRHTSCTRAQKPASTLAPPCDEQFDLDFNLLNASRSPGDYSHCQRRFTCVSVNFPAWQTPTTTRARRHSVKLAFSLLSVRSYLESPSCYVCLPSSSLSTFKAIGPYDTNGRLAALNRQLSLTGNCCVGINFGWGYTPPRALAAFAWQRTQATFVGCFPHFNQHHQLRLSTSWSIKARFRLIANISGKFARLFCRWHLQMSNHPDSSA